MKNIIILCLLMVFPIVGESQIIVLDPGHGYSSSGGNPDGRSSTEILTNLNVGLRTRTKLQNYCSNETVHMTRTIDRGWISITQRRNMINNWQADRFISIHCNAGGGTGTETFYCNLHGNTSPKVSFSNKVQREMASQGQWTSRRSVEDRSYMPYHFGVLRTSRIGVLNEIGFVDRTSDRNKLNSSTWRDRFANAYYTAIKSNLSSLNCTGNNNSNAPGSFNAYVTRKCSGNNPYNVITWTPSAGASYYKIYRNNSLYTTVTGTSYTNWYVFSGVHYRYKIQAVNSNGTTWNANGERWGTGLYCNNTSRSQDSTQIPEFAESDLSDQMDDFKISVSPNPTEREFSVVVNHVFGQDVEILVTNNFGISLYQSKEQSRTNDYVKSFDIGNERPGLYYVQVMIDGKEHQFTVIKK